MKLDVFGIGNPLIDILVTVSDQDIKDLNKNKGGMHLIDLKERSKILDFIKDREITYQCGGSCPNTMISLSQFGFKTAVSGKVGKDDHGERILKHLKYEKVDFVGAIGKHMTAYSIVLDSIEEDRTILAFKGSSNHLRYRELQCGTFNTPWFYFSSMVDESYKTLEKLAKYAKKKKIKIAFNPSNYLCEKGLSYLRKVLKNTEILILNSEESRLLVGSGTLEQNLKALHRVGPKIVVITLGKDGVIASDSHHVYQMKPPKVKVHETTGAGDAFAAGFVAGIIKKDSMDFALRLGSANAAGCISHYGAQQGLPKLDRALKMIKKLKLHVKKV